MNCPIEHVVVRTGKEEKPGPAMRDGAWLEDQGGALSCSSPTAGGKHWRGQDHCTGLDNLPTNTGHCLSICGPM